ncbi:Aerobic cobaltochelatase subunit CobN [Tenacibaculum litopenaei]|uniref:cobaltochelatase subunit CobN n=1 Tax=Tenacibaculum litopenaei TaxID=396016 RepID=UPI0038967480
MHLIATIPGGWNPDDDGVFYIDQKPGNVVFLSASDTDIHAMNEAYRKLYGELGTQLPSLRMTNLVYLKQELTIDTYIEEVLTHAEVIVCSLLGGMSYYRYLVEALKEMQEQTGCKLLFIPAHEPDYELMQQSSVPLEEVHQCRNYLQQGGEANTSTLLKYVCQQYFSIEMQLPEVTVVAPLFLYTVQDGIVSKSELESTWDADTKVAVVIAYRAHYLSNNLEPIKALTDSLAKEGLTPVVAFAQSFRDREILEELEAELRFEVGSLQVILNTSGFTVKSTDHDSFIFENLKVPVLQTIFSTTNKEVWKEGLFGLPPTDIAMNIALPEIDGRIIGKAISFKKEQEKDPLTDSALVKYEAYLPACNFMTAMAKQWSILRNLSNNEKKIALILPNYPNKDSRLANGVGLDTPESCVQVLAALKEAGYEVGKQLPSSGTEVIHWLTQLTTNDPNTTETRPHSILYSLSDFKSRFDKLSAGLKAKVREQWGNMEEDPYFTESGFVVPGMLLGNVFLSIQPSRGYNQDPQSIYHSPDLPPTYQYLSYYFWLRDNFDASAVIHLGKHGNLEWLPGKSVSLNDETCFPSAIFGTLPHFYPFIINDPGEGTQAKRRNQAVIIDHLIPPMTRAETYGSLVKLEHLVDEYYEASSLDTKRSKVLEQEIAKLVKQSQLNVDLNITSDDVDELLVKLDGYLCELKEAQIRDGLHIFGQAPTGEQLTDLLMALHRPSSQSAQGITQALSKDLGVELPIYQTDYDTPLNYQYGDQNYRTVGQWVAFLEEYGKKLLQSYQVKKVRDTQLPNFNKVLSYLEAVTLPAVEHTSDEIEFLLAGLDGKYVPSGPSGAPTRGRVDLLPTGRNFYSVDVRTIPTETAYRLGERSAQLIIDRYLQEHGEYPETIGISVWGTATMRTGGDDIAQAMALLGVRPIWKNLNRRVTDFEIIPLVTLGRPRIDVTLRISGFFRDAFPDVINLFNAAVQKVAQLEEPLEDNPIKKRVLAETEYWLEQGLERQQSEQRAQFRVFGSKPGSYGAGLQGLIDEKNWNSPEDLAKVYINWSGYAYGTSKQGVSAHESFKHRLQSMQVVMQNQDNREHDILDSDDYYQFHGGLANAVQTERGEQPSIYFGDHSRPENPKVKTLKEELLKVYRSRVVNPKWIAGVKRHGYKGVFEMAATLDYLFAYDATTNSVDDFMYEGITEAYLLDEETKNFIEEHNPWALKDMSERLLEAVQRGMWENPSDELVEKLQQLFLEGEGRVE